LEWLLDVASTRKPFLQGDCEFQGYSGLVHKQRQLTAVTASSFSSRCQIREALLPYPGNQSLHYSFHIDCSEFDRHV